MAIRTVTANTGQTQSALNTVSSRRRTFSMPVNVNGLNPGTQFRLFVNNVDMTWATKQFGKRMGDNLIVGNDGSLNLQFMGELTPNPPISRNPGPGVPVVKNSLFQLIDNLNIARAATIVPDYQYAAIPNSKIGK